MFWLELATLWRIPCIQKNPVNKKNLREGMAARLPAPPVAAPATATNNVFLVVLLGGIGYMVYKLEEWSKEKDGDQDPFLKGLTPVGKGPPSPPPILKDPFKSLTPVGKKTPPPPHIVSKPQPIGMKNPFKPLKPKGMKEPFDPIGMKNPFKPIGLKDPFKPIGMQDPFKPLKPKGLKDPFKPLKPKGLKDPFKPLKPKGLKDPFKPIGLKDPFKPIGLKDPFDPIGMQDPFKPITPVPKHVLEPMHGLLNPLHHLGPAKPHIVSKPTPTEEPLHKLTPPLHSLEPAALDEVLAIQPFTFRNVWYWEAQAGHNVTGPQLMKWDPEVAGTYAGIVNSASLAYHGSTADDASYGHRFETCGMDSASEIYSWPSAPSGAWQEKFQNAYCAAFPSYMHNNFFMSQ
jgi:hypothetical protein